MSVSWRWELMRTGVLYGARTRIPDLGLTRRPEYAHWLQQTHLLTGAQKLKEGPTSTSNCSCNPLDFVRCQIALLTGNIDPKDQTCACCYGKVVTNPQFQNFANSPGISYVAGVSDFMGQLQSPGMWIRIGAVMFGLLIIAIAIWKMI